MTERLELQPGPLIPDSLPVRGALFGAAIGFGGSLCYLMVSMIIGYAPVLVAELANTWPITGPQLPTTPMIAAFYLIVALLYGVLPATVAGLVAGAIIGLILRLRPPQPLAEWLTGTLVCVAALAVLVGVFAAFLPDLAGSGLAAVFLAPSLIFVLAGGPFAILLRRYAEGRAAIRSRSRTA
ncbi:hypothetical protein [Microlunatus parietis]|uniref:Uncharacterized protein n=1 Tax=Microlunatus parietis TaxID=682979 RepID=A0A7Y9LFY8_9ACTN|nr:hypothetical protein [Microlunatus parietis]NYE75480.1 hypothetical protein [Microlunatus parietis]